MKVEKFFTKYVMHILFFISIWLTIRWSDLPVIENRIIEFLFCHEGYVDNILLNLVLGYITGYIIYILSVLLPQKIRNTPATIETLRQLISIYHHSIYLLLLMYKSVCTKEEWINISNNQNDLDCLNDEFIKKMNTFDVQLPAYTLLKKRNGESLKWIEYLTLQYERIFKQIDDLFIRYNSYLDDELVKVLMNCKNSRYLDMFLANNFSLYLREFIEDGDKMIYYELIPMELIYEFNHNLSPIFYDNIIFKDYIEELKELHKFLESQKNSLDVVLNIKNDFAIDKLRNNNVGRTKDGLIVR